MSHRQERILYYLGQGDQTVHTLASILDAPEASIRRDVQVLRRNGHNIAFALNGEYRYAPPAPVAVAETPAETASV